MSEKKFAQELAEWRHQIHQNPEAAFEEVKTAAFVAGKLKEWGYDVHTAIGKTGIVANLKAGTGKTVIGLRADMDCICMNEEGEHPYTSCQTACMHVVMTDIPFPFWVQQSFWQKIRILTVPSDWYFSRRRNQVRAL